MNVKLICIVVLFCCFSCHNGNFFVAGTVKSIEQGKDGYNALIVDTDGKEYETTISRNDIGIRYKELEVADILIIYGDSSQYGNRFHIHATKIVE